MISSFKVGLFIDI